MSAPAMSHAPGHIHLPSVHIRAENGVGFDYEEDLFIRGRGSRQRIYRTVRLVVIEAGEPTLIRDTFDYLCAEEWATLQEILPELMEEGNPDARAAMEDAARQEVARQLKIARGEEQACAQCGCSQSRACSGGCIWARENLCSRCAGGVR